MVTQASSAIPFIPLYISALFKVMKAKKIHEDCVQQLYRLYAHRLYNPGAPLQLDDQNRIRLDDFEMRADVQEEVDRLLETVDSENFETLIDFAGYQEEFLKLFGFGLPGVDYTANVAVERKLNCLVP